jgi:hypothetical protein
MVMLFNKLGSKDVGIPRGIRFGRKTMKTVLDMYLGSL